MQKHALIGDLAYLITSAVSKTLRSRIYAHPDVDPTQPFILSFWHGKLFLPIMLFSGWEQKKIAALISPSRDGAILTRWMQRLGYNVVRGSSNSKATSSTVKLVALGKQGYSLGMAADGPRGPMYSAKLGSAYLAQKTGLPILPIGAAYQNAKQFQSWDRFLFPKPFSKAILYLDQPFYVRPEDNLELVTRDMELKLHVAEAKAALISGGEPILMDKMNRIKIQRKSVLVDRLI